MEDIDLVALVGSRLCHDLLGPTSAVVNGLELITSEPELGEEALQMVVKSADQVSTRLQFFRGAYGMATGLTFRAAHGLAMAYFGEGRVTVDWRAEPEALDRRLPPGSAKLALNLLLLGSDLLGRGGTLTVAGVDRAGPPLVIGVHGDALRDDIGLPGLERGPSGAADLNPRTVQPILVGRIAKSIGARITSQRGTDGTIVFAVDV